ncbi:hypothetical protein E3P91_03966 [Wallemia ichthyophaga]|nr:hypothetical protein E3P91_03966 [Wallemia ichthyophaga]TIB58736.1 hypothetical protein E3P78_03826 [Wallemia ichthyophaga]
MNQDGNDPDNPDISKQPPIGSRAAREQHQEQRVRQRGGQVYRSGPLQLNIPRKPPAPQQPRQSGERERLPVPSPFNNPPMRTTAMTNLFRHSLSRSRSPIPQQQQPPSPLFANVRSSSQRSYTSNRPENFQTQATLIDSDNGINGSSPNSNHSNQGRAGSPQSSFSSGRSSLSNNRSSSSVEERRRRMQSERSAGSEKSALSTLDRTTRTSEFPRDRLTDIDSVNQKVDGHDRDILFGNNPLFNDIDSTPLDDGDMSADKSILSDREKRMSTQLIQSSRATPPPSNKREKGKGRVRGERKKETNMDPEREKDIEKETEKENSTVDKAHPSTEPTEDFDSLVAPTPQQAPASIKKRARKSDTNEVKERKKARKSDNKEAKKARKSENKSKKMRKSRVTEDVDVKAETDQSQQAQQTQPSKKKEEKKEKKNKKDKAARESDSRQVRRRRGGVQEVRSDEEDETRPRKSESTVFKVPELPAKPVKRKRKSAIRHAYRDGKTQADVDREDAAAAKAAKNLARKRKKDRRIDDEEMHLFHTISLSDQTTMNPFAQDIDKKHEAVASRAIAKSQRQINEIDVFWNLLVNEVDDVIDQTESRTLLHDIRHFNALLEKEFTEKTVWFEYCVALNARLATAKAQQKDMRKRILETQKSIAQVSKQMAGVQQDWTESKLHREEMSKLNLWMNDVQSRRIPLVAGEEMDIDKKANVQLKQEVSDIYSSIELIRTVYSEDPDSFAGNVQRFGNTQDNAGKCRMYGVFDDDGETLPADEDYEDIIYEMEWDSAGIVGDGNIAAAENDLDEEQSSDEESIGSVSSEDVSIDSDSVFVSDVGDVSDEESSRQVDDDSRVAATTDSPNSSPSSGHKDI